MRGPISAFENLEAMISPVRQEDLAIDGARRLRQDASYDGSAAGRRCRRGVEKRSLTPASAKHLDQGDFALVQLPVGREEAPSLFESSSRA